MRTFSSVERRFSGSHTLKGHPVCGKDCGHTWTVRVTFAGDEDASRFGAVVDMTAATSLLDAAVFELRGRDLGAMIRPAVPSPEGIAHWFYERLAVRFPTAEVEVWQEDGRRSILRDPDLR